jgi:iron complex outermembrane receptor protein
MGGRVREEVQFAPLWTAVAAFGLERTVLDAVNTTNTFATPTSQPVGTLIPVLRYYWNVAPEVDLLFRPEDQWQFRARAATGYGTPQASNLFVTPAGVPGNNTQLQTQTNLGFDLGADWKVADSVSLSVTGFYELFHNEFVTQSPGAGLLNFTFNAPGSVHRGVEVGAVWYPAPGWRALLAYTRDDQYYTNYVEQLSAGTKTNSFDRAGNRIPGIEPNNMYFRLSYDQPDGPLAGWGTFAESYWRDSYYVDNANLLRIPGYALVNLNLHYDVADTERPWRNIRLFLEIQNLFGVTYVASANNVTDSINATTGQQNPASVVAAAGGSIYAGAPRTVIGGVRIRF